MKKLLLILVLAVMSNSAMAEYNEWHKGNLRAIYLGNKIQVSVNQIVVEIDNKCDHLTDELKRMSCRMGDSDYKTKYQKDLYYSGRIYKNVKNLYESKIEGIVGLKVIEEKYVKEDTLHLQVKIRVAQKKKKDVFDEENETYYLYSNVILREGATGFTGRKWGGGIQLTSFVSGGFAEDQASIEGEIYESIDETIGKMKKIFEEANKFCIKEECTISKARERARECHNKNFDCKEY
jgi:hypothetical protein